MFNGLIVDRHNKPFMLNTFSDLDKGMSPKQSSAQQTVLSRYVPLILFKLVKNKECYIYIKLLLMLQKIKDLIFAPQLNEELLQPISSTNSFLYLKTCILTRRFAQNYTFLFITPPLFGKMALHERFGA